MSTCFFWFRDYKITHHGIGHWYDWYELTYIGGGSTSHSSGNIIKVQNLIEKYGNKRIPQINDERIDSTDYDLCLIEPSEMVEICNKILANTEVDEFDMRSRIEWFKKLSEEGHYLVYDNG